MGWPRASAASPDRFPRPSSLVLYRGERPDRRRMEAIEFNLMGWASLDELGVSLRPKFARKAKKA
jgi:hypothetical protein